MDTKIIFKILLLFITCLCTSCEEWLDVRPKSQIKEGDLFTTESGFREALIGAYASLGTIDTYGGNCTMGLIDVLAQQYSSVKWPFTSIWDYNYEDSNCKSRLDAIWISSYSVVANCNYLLKNIVENGSVLSDNTHKLIEAEAIALRSYLLFDLLRGYAPSYKTGSNKMGIPLVREVTNKPVFPQTVAEELDILVNDLKQAREIIRDVDPIGPAFTTYTDPTFDYLGLTDQYLGDNGFWIYRQSRLNYYGITALLARICLYKEDYLNAFSYAQEVIESKKFSFINESSLPSELISSTIAEVTAAHEYISSIYVYNLKEGLNDQFFLDAQASLTISRERKNDIFGGDGLDFDVRARHFFSIPNGNNQEYINKYMTGNNIPLLKLGEMYLIAAESSGNIDWLKEFRRLRGYPNVEVAPNVDLQEELAREYRREFIAEGQLFYYYKRMNYPQIPYTSIPTTESVYVFPLPDDEIEFGYSSNNY